MKYQELIDKANSICKLQSEYDSSSNTIRFSCSSSHTPELCDWLFNDMNYKFIGLVIEQYKETSDLFYLFIGDIDGKKIRVSTSGATKENHFYSISKEVHASDWYEREASELFGLHFEGHPRLRNFILHDETLPKGTSLMLNNYSFSKQKNHMKPQKVLNMPGSFIMPIGPVFSGEAESVNFQLETIGEEIFRAKPRLFYKHRAVEKMAEGKNITTALLMAERFAGTTAFAHALAFSMAVEQIANSKISKRAQVLRTFMAELERFRHHIGSIEAICNSTGLVVSANQVAIIEEEILRLVGELTGHRYMFGLAIPGGLSRDFSEKDLRNTSKIIQSKLPNFNKIEKLLMNTGSFLDRHEEVGIVTEVQARNYGLLGPVARASNQDNDLRKMQPYCDYEHLSFTVPRDTHCDGLARLKILFEEARQSASIIKQISEDLPDGDYRTNIDISSGTGLAGVEAPRGSTWHWLSLDENKNVKRYKIITPSFANWHGFHLAAENFAFQDFPIILATFGLSVAENDR